MIQFLRLILPLVCCILGLGPLAAQYEADDAYALAAPQERDQSLDQVAAYLFADNPSKASRLRRIFTWVAHNITYDEGRQFELDNRTDVSITLQRRTAVCVGYACLFAALSEKAGLDCETVSGYSKSRPGIPPSMAAPDHVWNAVQPDGQWQLIDVTWASNYAANPEQYYRRDFNYYYCSSPAQFLLDHLPADPFWQLVDCPRSPDQFLQNPSDTTDLFPTPPCWNLTDSLAQYWQKDKNQRTLESLDRSYRYISSTANAEALGQSYMDRFIRLSDVEKELQYGDAMDTLITVQKQLIQLADKAQEYIELYDWQKENLAYIHLNYAVALSRQLAAGEGDLGEKGTLQLMEKSLLQASDLLQKVPSNALSENGLDRCTEYLAMVREYLKE